MKYQLFTFTTSKPLIGLKTWLNDDADLIKVLLFASIGSHLVFYGMQSGWEHRVLVLYTVATMSILFAIIHVIQTYVRRHRRIPAAACSTIAIGLLYYILLSWALKPASHESDSYHLLFVAVHISLFAWLFTSGVFDGFTYGFFRFAQSIGLEAGVLGITNEESTGKLARQRIAQLLDEGVSDLRILVITGYTDIVESNSPIHKWFEQLSHQNGPNKPKVRLLLLDPLSTFAKHRMEKIHETRTSKENSVEENINKFNWTRKYLESLKERYSTLEYRIYTSRPLFRMYLGRTSNVNSEHCWGAIQTYMNNSPGAETPLYEFWKRPRHRPSDAFVNLASQAFEFIWERGFEDYSDQALEGDGALVTYMARMYGVGSDHLDSTSIADLRRKVIAYAREHNCPSVTSQQGDSSPSQRKANEKETDMGQRIRDVSATNGSSIVINYSKGDAVNTSTGESHGVAIDPARLSQDISIMVIKAREMNEDELHVRELAKTEELVKAGKHQEAMGLLKTMRKWAFDFASRVGASYLADLLKGM